MPLKRAQRAVGRLGGAELFAQLYAQYDLLVVWGKVKPRREYYGQPGQRPIRGTVRLMRASLWRHLRRHLALRCAQRA